MKRNFECPATGTACCEGGCKWDDCILEKRADVKRTKPRPNPIDTNGGRKCREKKADHEYLDSQGNVVNEGENAVGYRYSLVAGGEPFEWYWSEANEDERRMLALFGAKTLSTNETSQARQKGRAAPDEQMAAIRERFELIRCGKWVDRTREGPQVDQPILATCVCKHLVQIGKKSQAEVDGGYYEVVLKKLAEDEKYLRDCAKHPQVSIYYAQAKGRPVVTDDRLAA
jgi:hypothetical protein